MINPPKRIKIIQAGDGETFMPKDQSVTASMYSFNYDLRNPWTEHFYTLEEKDSRQLTQELLGKIKGLTKPMEPKKEMTAKKPIIEMRGQQFDGPENSPILTATDAWIAMAKGECVSCSDIVHKIKGRKLVYFSTSEGWIETYEIYTGPYSIVEDPSKPKEVEDENKTPEISEKERRIYYQNMVYEICNIVELKRGEALKIVVGTAENPSRQLQTIIEEDGWFLLDAKDAYNKSRQDILTQEAVKDLFAESILIHLDRFFVRKS